jgi:hypothetical protein
MENITKYDQASFLEKKKAHEMKTPADRWGGRIEEVIRTIEILKLDADPAWDVFNHLDECVDRLTETSVYASGVPAAV